jgi:hypothetical protein
LSFSRDGEDHAPFVSARGGSAVILGAVSRLDRYLARLPNGADSYPDVLVKASTFTAAFADKPVPIQPDRVPLPIARLITEPPPINAWVSEVQMVGIFKLIGDYHFEGRGGTPAFLQWVYEQNRKLLGGRVYRTLFSLLTPETLFRGVQHRWGAFRRGTELVIVDRSFRHALLELRYRSYLLDDEGLLAIGAAFRAVAEATGAKDNEVELVDVTPTRGRLRVTWTP